jgi:hypothetical protein
MSKSGIVAVLWIVAALTPVRAEPPKLIVHEWGTFTNFAGADGVYMDYRPLIGNDLPAFVFDRSKQAQLTYRIKMLSAFIKADVVTRSRMETPVTYFYTDQPMELQARVDFPRGLLTEFYPPGIAMGPPAMPLDDAPPIGKSFLDWGRITITPQHARLSPPPRIPAVEKDNPYAAARQTDSDIVRVTNGDGTFDEKFLFYRGVGNFDLPVKMQSLGDDRFAIHNTGREPIHAAILVQVRKGRIRFASIGPLEHDATIQLPTEPRTLEALGDAMADDLAAEGLYVKEARAMVNTWKASWFGEEGTRLLYLPPQSFTDAELPLHIMPKPSTCLRVMVGRLETLTPEMESRIEQLLEQMGSDDCAAREEAMRQFRELGRFAEPALRRISRGPVENVLAALRSER